MGLPPLTGWLCPAQRVRYSASPLPAAAGALRACVNNEGVAKHEESIKRMRKLRILRVERCGPAFPSAENPPTTFPRACVASVPAQSPRPLSPLLIASRLPFPGPPGWLRRWRPPPASTPRSSGRSAPTCAHPPARSRRSCPLTCRRAAIRSAQKRSRQSHRQPSPQRPQSQPSHQNNRTSLTAVPEPQRLRASVCCRSPLPPRTWRPATWTWWSTPVPRGRTSCSSSWGRWRRRRRSTAARARCSRSRCRCWCCCRRKEERSASVLFVRQFCVSRCACAQARSVGDSDSRFRGPSSARAGSTSRR